MECEYCGFQIMKGDNCCSSCGATNRRNIVCSPSGRIKKGQTIEITLDGKRVFTGYAPEDSVWRLPPDLGRKHEDR
jgi:hypothetical protein